MKKVILILILTIFIIGCVKEKIETLQPNIQEETTKEISQENVEKRLGTVDWESLAFVEAPSSHQIENVTFYAETGKCYAAGAMGLLKYWGTSEEEIQDYWKFIQVNGKGGPPDFAFALREYGYSEYLYFGYAKNYNYDPRLARAINHFTKDHQKQVKLFENKEEALSFLKKLIALNVPAMVAVREKLLGGELGGDDYILVYGYDENNIYSYKLPGVKTSDPTEDFLQRWELKKEFEGKDDSFSQFPGNYNIIFLKPKGED